MANPRRSYSQAPFEDNVQQSTREWMDWVTSAVNQLSGQAGVPPAKGVNSLNPNTVDPTSNIILSKGSRITSMSTGCSFTCPSTTAINIYWDGSNSSSLLRIYRDDQTIAGPFSGSVQVTGLTANTKYFFYPYLDEATQTVKFVSLPGAVGTPPIAYTTQTIQNAIAQMYQGRTPLFSNLAVTGITTPAAGTTPATPSGGGGGGAGYYGGKNLQ